MKKNFLFFALQICAVSYTAQTIYSNSFGNLSLQSYTTGSTPTLYSNIPAGFTLINDGLENNAGPSYNPNKPFQVSGLATDGWAVLYNAAENDTFLVSTSWLDTTQVSANRWVVTPAITNITANTVLTWLAKCPDPNYRDGYEVYATNKQGALVASDFTIGDRLFALADGNSGNGENPTWTRRSVPIGAFAGQTLRFAFRNNSKDLYQIWIDDIAVTNTPNNLDVSIGNDVEKKYILVNAGDSVKINLTNVGASAVNTLKLNYQIGNSSVNTENANFVNGGLNYGQVSRIKFQLPYSVSQPGLYALKVWVSTVNSLTASDQNQLNDTTRCLVTVQSSSPPKTVLFEQFVSAHNGEGPDAQERALALQASDVIVVNIHDQDSMRLNPAMPLLTDYKKNFATAMADRAYFGDAGTIAAERSYYSGHVAARKTSITPASVSIINKNYNAGTNLLSFTLKVDFTGEVRGDYRLNAYLTENQVGGPVSDNGINGYNQWNNFYTIPWSPYYQKGTYSSIANTYILNLGQYRHQNALVHAFDGAYGSSGTIPANGGTQGQSYQQTFTVNIPAQANGINKFNPDNLYIVGFVTEYSANPNERRVLNATKEKITANSEVVSLPEFAKNAEISVYPNPSTGLFYFNTDFKTGYYTIAVHDVLGRCMRLVDVANSERLQPLDLSMLPDGVYLLKISSGGRHFTEKVVLSGRQN